tara:strand:+ start:2318 stop:2983 length:666 start_codon:yes stop_codon:yes gene_type:complete
MARFLTTIPSNSGFANFGTVQAYPTGGSGPTAYGPTSYFGSDPRPAEPGDSLYNPIDLGDFSSVFRAVTLNNKHGGLTRRVTTFYKIKLNRNRSIQFTQNFSQFAYTRETNRNTLVAFYKILPDGRREELPINDEGYVSPESSIDYNEENLKLEDYPSTRLDPGDYLFLITNDIRFMETVYSISVNVSVVDWRFVYENVEESLDFASVADGTADSLDFGSV